MDSKITLSFNKDIIQNAKKYAKNNNISLSRLTEFLLEKVSSSNYKTLEDYPISEWVNIVSEGEVEYKVNRNRKEMKTEFFKSKK
jgi:Family of unknown function (DUF6364)